jgi:hypothetical protein
MSKVHLHGAGHGPGHHHAGDDEEEDAGGGVDAGAGGGAGGGIDADAGGGADADIGAPAGADPPGDGDAHTRSRWPGRLELVITVLLGLAAVTGAFAALKNEQRNHEATLDFSEGIRNFDDAGQFYATGNATFTHDQSLFLEYAKAIQSNDKELATYIRTNLMGPTLQAGVKWWEGPNAKSKNPEQTPFTDKNPDYGIPQLTEAQSSTNASKANFAAARKEQDKADHFTLVEVILATALFLYGIAGVTRNMTLKLGTLGTGSAIFLIALILLLTG